MASLFSSDRPNPFALLGIEPRYDVDKSALEKAFFERSKELHPDRFASAPANERVAALSKARALNDAYALLKQDAARAEYLLAQKGLTIGDNERIDPVLVMELLEEREALAEARVAGDLAHVQAMSDAMRARRMGALEAVKAGFGAGHWEAVKQQLILLRYVERYLEECDAALDDEPGIGSGAEGQRG